MYALEGERNLPGICTRRDDDVVFQLPLVAVVDQINAGVDIPILYFRIVSHIGVPLPRVITENCLRHGIVPSGES